MRIITYDFEVTAYDWLLVMKDFETGTFTCIHNDNEAVKACISNDCCYFGFNTKHYDKWIMQAICLDRMPEEVKKVNDYIIGGGDPWKLFPNERFYFNNADIMDDMQIGQSLKSIEGHLFMDITESTVSFDIDHPWSDEELAEMIYYCKADVNATEHLIKLRKDYLRNKIRIGAMVGIPEEKAVGMTNAKLTAEMLKAQPLEHNDERDYKVPDNLLKEYIPEEVFAFFARLIDENISDDDVFHGNLEIKVGECPVTIGFGGIHGAIPNYIWKEGAE